MSAAGKVSQDLWRKIPLSEQMGLQVLSADTSQARLTCAHKPNVNHVQTVFGGSLYSACALACYVLFRQISGQSGIESDNLVIQKGEVDYISPVAGDFEILSKSPGQDEVDRFLKQLQKHGKARLELQSEVLWQSKICARFTGRYVFQK